MANVEHKENAYICVWNKRHYKPEFSTATVYRQQRHRASVLLPVTIPAMAKAQATEEFKHYTDVVKLSLAIWKKAGITNIIEDDFIRNEDLITESTPATTPATTPAPQVATTDTTPAPQVPQTPKAPEVPQAPEVLINGIDNKTTEATLDFIKQNYESYKPEIRDVLKKYGWTKDQSDALVMMAYPEAFK